MSRRRHLIAYDISDPVRLRRVIKVMERYGERLQYSVFLCDLSSLEYVRWEADIHAVVNLSHDSVVSIDLGPLPHPTPIRALGRPRSLPPTGAVVV